MDALIEWEDSTRNVVSTTELKCMGSGYTFRKGQRIKMLWEEKYGTIINIETESEEEELKLQTNKEEEQKKRKLQKNKEEEQKKQNPKKIKEEEQKKRKTKGEEYVHPKTEKTVPARNTIVKPRCQNIRCAKMGRECSKFSEEDRKELYQAFYETGSLQLQREYIVRYVEKTDITQRTTKNSVSRRSCTYSYHLPNDGNKTPVCKVMFLSTLNISEKTVRTALEKQKSKKYQKEKQTKQKLQKIIKEEEKTKVPDEQEQQKEVQEQVSENIELDSILSDYNNELPIYDSDKDPSHVPESPVRNCEASDCQNEIFSSCHICKQLLCYYHFINMGPCENDHKLVQHEPDWRREKMWDRSISMENLEPEALIVEGSEIEQGVQPCLAKRNSNKKKESHKSRIKGEEYVHPKTGKTVPPRSTVVKPRCQNIRCAKMGRECYKFSDEDRKELNHDFYGTGSLQLQREYIVRYVEKTDVIQRTTKNSVSRRSCTYSYHFPKDGNKIPVCKVMFFSTLNISEKTMRTALKKQKTKKYKKEKQTKQKLQKIIEEEEKTKVPEEQEQQKEVQEQVSENIDLDSIHSDYNSELPIYDSEKDPSYLPESLVRNCEASDCQNEIFSSCHICKKLLCYYHFINMESCENDHKLVQQQPEKMWDRSISMENLVPEAFLVDGSEREEGTQPCIAKRNANKKKESHKSRTKGEEYVHPKTGKTVPARNAVVKPRCQNIRCAKMGRECYKFSEEDRKELNQAFYGTGSLQLQREYIVRYVEKADIIQRTTKNSVSRRSCSYSYHLPKDGNKTPVCKVMFLNTLNISEKAMRTALSKQQATGTVEPEGRGGRPERLLEEDKCRREAIVKHINRFPRMESHYIHNDSKMDHLHPDLNKQKMFELFKDEHKAISASYSTYCNVLSTQNISFHNPKKDMCEICENYKKGDNEKMKQLEELYQQHTKEKEALWKFKELAKSGTNDNVAVATFDLQEVIYLPQTNDNQLFYKRRLANYNFSVYELKSRVCHCYTWHEGLGKRGSSEIGTCLKMYLEHVDYEGKSEVILFADGCPDQNKNSIIAAMLLHLMNKLENVQTISLLYFEANHGQSEGDSAHSSIKTAIDNAGDIYVPAQLLHIFKLARRKNPNTVHTLQTDDFLDFKKLSKDLGVLDIRTDDQGNVMNWTNIMQVMVRKNENNKIFFTTSHLQKDYMSLTIKQRKPLNVTDDLQRLYSQPPKIAQEKYKDLMSLCEGDFPMVRLPEYVQFFKSLSH